MYKIKQMIPQSIKNIYHLFQAILANVWYGFPSKKINPHTKGGYLRFLIKLVSLFSGNWRNFGVGVKVIGITGTDGKTTTCQMTAKILQESGKKVALASTINFSINGVEEKNLSHFTTESSFAVQRFIKKAVEAGCEYLVLETSSHSLDQYRVWGVEFKTAVITNVTREHLDYHQTMENYRKAKKMLFEAVAKKTKVISHQQSVIIVNADMEAPEDFLGFDVDKKYGYTTSYQSSAISNQKIEIVHAENIELGIQNSKFSVQNCEFELNIPGEFNVENALAAICVGLGEGIDLETMKEALAKIKGVAGRMEGIQNDLGVYIMVDFALTPNALERLYKTLFETKKPSAKILAVFGSCGDRDKGKRPIMGEVVSKYADTVILTNDEPYHEDPLKIIEEIAVGVKNKMKDENLFIVPDRREAIRKVLRLAAPDDVVVLTGMGNFESMIVGDKKIPWNDRQVIEEELKNLS